MIVLDREIPYDDIAILFDMRHKVRDICDRALKKIVPCNIAILKM